MLRNPSFKKALKIEYDVVMKAVRVSLSQECEGKG